MICWQLKRGIEVILFFAEYPRWCYTHSPPASEQLLHAPSWQITGPDDQKDMQVSVKLVACWWKSSSTENEECFIGAERLPPAGQSPQFLKIRLKAALGDEGLVLGLKLGDIAEMLFCARDNFLSGQRYYIHYINFFHGTAYILKHFKTQILHQILLHFSFYFAPLGKL